MIAHPVDRTLAFGVCCSAASRQGANAVSVLVCLGTRIFAPQLAPRIDGLSVLRGKICLVDTGACFALLRVAFVAFGLSRAPSWFWSNRDFKSWAKGVVCVITVIRTFELLSWLRW